MDADKGRPIFCRKEVWGSVVMGLGYGLFLGAFVNPFLGVYGIVVGVGVALAGLGIFAAGRSDRSDRFFRGGR